MIKAAEKAYFEDERHIEIRMKLVWQVEKAGALIKEKDSLIKQQGGGCRTFRKRSIKVKPNVVKQCKIWIA